MHMVDENVDSIDIESRTAIKGWVGSEVGNNSWGELITLYYILNNL